MQGGLYCSPSPQPCLAVCVGLCLSFPGARRVESWAVLHPATSDHSRLSSLGLFFSISLVPLLETLSLAWVAGSLYLTVPCGAPQSLQDTGWQFLLPPTVPGAPQCDSHTCPQRASGMGSRTSGLSRLPPFPCCVLCFEHDTHTRGLCCSYGVDPLVIGTSYSG